MSIIVRRKKICNAKVTIIVFRRVGRSFPIHPHQQKNTEIGKERDLVRKREKA